MNIYLLEAKSDIEDFDPWYDKSFGHVVRAESEINARLLACTSAMDEGKDVWLDESKTSCELLAEEVNGEESLLLSDQRWA